MRIGGCFEDEDGEVLEAQFAGKEEADRAGACDDDIVERGAGLVGWSDWVVLGCVVVVVVIRRCAGGFEWLLSVEIELR